MRTPDVIVLVGENPAAHGVFDAPDTESRTIYVSVRSVGMNEAYQAMANGLHPTVVFRLSDSADYHGEKICLFRGKQYRVVRTYQTGFGIELTCEEIAIDRAIMEGNDV
jgi:hypothetical protein